MVRKKFLLSIFTLAVLTVMSAFAPATKFKNASSNTVLKSPTISNWFIYVGPNNPLDFSEYTNVNNYILVSDPSELCEGGYDALCAILCPNRGDDKPDFTSTNAEIVVDQLYDFWLYGYPAGGALILKDL